MKRNVIRPIALGGVAGLAVFAGMIALVEYDRWNTVVQQWDRLRLDIAAEQINQASFRPIPGPRSQLAPELLTGATDSGAPQSGPATHGHTYPIFEGPNGETFGNPTTTKE